jgi:hypothetical protein
VGVIEGYTGSIVFSRINFVGAGLVSGENAVNDSIGAIANNYSSGIEAPSFEGNSVLVGCGNVTEYPAIVIHIRVISPRMKFE